LIASCEGEFDPELESATQTVSLAKDSPKIPAATITGINQPNLAPGNLHEFITNDIGTAWSKFMGLCRLLMSALL